MCGIAGIFHYGEPSAVVDRAALLRMTRILEHRGPDDEALYIRGPIGFGHRRLSIVDLSPSGRQPMLTEDGQFCLTYNGEVYNHADFRPRLAAHGVRFRGTSDSETLLELLRAYGPRILSDVAGIFALGLYDQQERRLLLARDYMGVKPLYYHDDGKRIAFASEIKSLLTLPDIRRDVDPESINQYLHFHASLFERTFLADVKQVAAGEFLEVGRNGIRRRRYAETDGFQPRHERPSESVHELKALLGRIVGEQLMSDVPVGAFFSGGIDSCAVAAFAKQAGVSLRCFGVHFSGQDVIDERPFQEAAAKALGLDLDLTTVDPRNFADDLLSLTWQQDQPVIGPALIPMFHVSRLASKKVKVCLGGQGADEIFGGYARYALASPGRVLKSWSATTPGEMKHGTSVGGNLRKQLADARNLKRLAKRLDPTESPLGRYFENFAHVPRREWERVFRDASVYSRPRAREFFQQTVSRSPALTPGDKLLHWDIQTYLTGLFHQDDRMSMASGLESRVPLADPRVVRFALHTGFDLKIRAGATKWILRQAVADVIPAEVLNRRKVGFDTPAESWMRGPHREFVHALLTSAASRSRPYWDFAGVRRVLENEDSPFWFDMVWKLASIEAWALTTLDRPTSRPHPVMREYESA